MKEKVCRKVLAHHWTVRKVGKIGKVLNRISPLSLSLFPGVLTQEEEETSEEGMREWCNVGMNGGWILWRCGVSFQWIDSFFEHRKEDEQKEKEK